MFLESTSHLSSEGLQMMFDHVASRTLDDRMVYSAICTSLSGA
jgi:hypothetical protein